VRYLTGVNGIVSAGPDPIAVPEEIVTEIERRGTHGIVELAVEPFVAGERIKIAAGPFLGFEGVFERYLSSHERVTVLLQTVESTGFRVVLPTAALAS
jgi:transcription antitermination factor NusG